MKSSRFFSGIWRINAILILICGLFGAAMLAFALLFFLRDSSRTQHTRNVMRVADREVDTAQESLSGFESIEGSPMLRATLWLKQEYGFGSGMKEASSFRNVLLFDPASGRARWLLPGFRGILVEEHRLPDKDYSTSPKPVRGFVYQAVGADSDGDGRLTRADAKDLYVSDPDGSHVHLAISGVENFNGAHWAEDTAETFLFYTKGGQYRVAKADLRNGTLISDAELRIDGATQER